MYYIMRKSYYVMHKLLRYAKNVLRYAEIITLCGETHVHLAEDRMEPVIHMYHRCIGGEVDADSSNHLSSNEQVCVDTIEVGISCSRYHTLYWTPPPRVERRQRFVFYTRLYRWHGENI